MKKAELIESILDHCPTAGTKKSVELMLDGLATTVQEALANGREVTLPGLGKFSVTERAERAGRNPQTGEPMTIPAARVPKFKAAKALKDGIV